MGVEEGRAVAAGPTPLSIEDTKFVHTCMCSQQGACRCVNENV